MAVSTTIVLDCLDVLAVAAFELESGASAGPTVLVWTLRGRAVANGVGRTLGTGYYLFVVLVRGTPPVCMYVEIAHDCTSIS